MKRRYVLIAAGAAVFVLLCIVWVNTVLTSDIAGAVGKLERSEREFRDARQALLYTTGDPAPALNRMLLKPRTSPQVRLRMLAIVRDLAARRDMKGTAPGVAAAVSDTSAALRLEALLTLAVLRAPEGLAVSAEVVRRENDTSLVRAAVRALQACAAPVNERLRTAIDTKDSALVDSCLTVLESLPVVNSMAQGNMTRYHAARGDTARARTSRLAAGWLDQFWAVGSFPAAHASAFHVQFAPETQAFDSTAEFDLGDGTRGHWVPLRLSGRDPWVDLNNLFTPHYSAAAYFVTFVRVPADREALLVISTPDGSRLYLNDSLVFDNRVFGYSGPERDIAPIRLRQGCNKLMLKNTQDHGGDWWQSCRLVGRDGWPMADATVSTMPCGKADETRN